MRVRFGIGCMAGGLLVGLVPAAAAADPAGRVVVHAVRGELRLPVGAGVGASAGRLPAATRPLGPAPAWSVNVPVTNSGFMGAFPADPVVEASNGFLVWGANDSLEIWDETTPGTTPVYGPTKLADFFAGKVADPCGTPSAHRGQPSVVYDQIGDRFFVGDIAYTGTLSNPTSDTWECLLVSKTGNPGAGGFQGYTFLLGGVTGAASKWVGEEPRMAVWPDRLYLAITERGTSGLTLGSTWLALNRQDAEALVAAPRAVKANITVCSGDAATTCGGWLPAQVRGTTAVASSRPALLVRMVVDGANSGDLEFGTWAIDWTTLSSNVAVGNLIRPAGGLQPACTNVATHACDVVPQYGTTQKLDSQGWILGGQNADFRSLNQALAPDQRHSYLTVAASVTSPSGTTAARWLQIDATAGLSIAQDATTPPDTGMHRFDPVAAMDRTGATLLGYLSSNPADSGCSICEVLANHVATDAANTIGPESFLYGGPDVQTNRSAFGGASITVAPNGCTFYDTHQDLNSNNGWQIGAIQLALPGCFDGTAPSLTVTKPTPDAPGNWYRKTAVTLTLDTSDTGGSGLAGPPACTDNGGVKVSATPVSGSQYTIGVSGQGGHAISCVSADRAGNVKTVGQVLVNLDATPPSLAVTVPPPDGANGWNTTSPVPVTITASDANSLVARAPDCSDNAGTPVASTPVAGSYQILVAGQGPHSFVCTVFDNAGNATYNQTPVTFKLDSVAPSMSITSGLNGFASRQQVSLGFSEAVFGDALSKLHVVDGGGSLVPTASVTGCSPDAGCQGPYTSVTALFASPPVAGECYRFTGSGITDVAGNPLVVPSNATCAPTHVDDADPVVTYRWQTVSLAAAMGGSFTQERWGGATASFTFSGSSVTWYTVKGPDQGVAGIRISNKGSAVFPASVNNYAAATQTNVPVTISGLPAGQHTLTIAVRGALGNKLKGTDSFVAVDAFAVNGGPPIATPGVRYHWTDGGGFGYVFTNTKGTSVSLRFRGTSVSWHAFVGPNDGKARVTIDGTNALVQDLYAADFAFVDFTYPGLSPGLHTLRIAVLGTKQAASSDTIVTVDGFNVS